MHANFEPTHIKQYLFVMGGLYPVKGIDLGHLIMGPLEV